MNRSALATFSLATAIAVMTLGYANPSFAGKPDCDGAATHPSCKGDEDPTESAAKYEAALTVGGFIFGLSPVTLNKRKNAYHGEEPVGMIRPPDGDPDQSAWDSVFTTPTCLALLSGSIDGVAAGDNWTINVSGSKRNGSVSNNPESDILIRFRDVVADNFPFVDIDFNLIGKIGYDGDGHVNIFLPDIDMTSSFTLDTFNFFASGSQGGGCRSGILDLYPTSVLEIKRIE